MDPRDFLAIAGAMHASLQEGERRTSIGRSYYSLFNSVKDTLARHGARFTDTGADHERLVRQLTRSPNTQAVRIGTALANLRVQRNDADYQMRIAIDARQSALAFQRAQSHLALFDGLPAASVVAIAGPLARL